MPIGEILRRPQSFIGAPAQARNRKIPLPRDIFQPERRAAAGIDFGDRGSLDALIGEIRGAAAMRAEAAPLVNGITLPGIAREVQSPINGSAIGLVHEADAAIGDAALAAAADGFASWTAWPIERRAAVLDRAADRLESDRGRFIALLQDEAGKTLDDALAELREAVDYCRYYAAQARITLAPQAMPGPTGESNALRYRGRGVFVCISPWNFPLAIFVGQIVAALVAGRHRQVAEAGRLPVGAGEDEEHAGRSLGGGDVDRPDARVRVRRAQHIAERHARQHHVADIAAAALDQPRILEPRHALTDCEFTHCILDADRNRVGERLSQSSGAMAMGLRVGQGHH